jgi:hypothetical protein
MTRAIVVFACPHNWEDHCNPRYCGTGRPYLNLAYPMLPGWTWPARACPSGPILMPVGPIVAAREPLPDDPVPKSAYSLHELAHAHDRQPIITYAAGVPDPGPLRTCSACGADIALNLDGELRAHGPKHVHCPGRGTGPALPAVVHSVLVRGERHWAARWENGTAAGRWWQRRPVTDAELKAHLSAAGRPEG